MQEGKDADMVSFERIGLRLLLFLTMSASILWITAPNTRAQEDSGYTVTTVGGTDTPITYDDQAVAGFSFTDMSFRSTYPTGMIFTVTITPPETATIQQVSLAYTFSNTGSRGEPAEVTQGDQPNTWVATLYALRGLTPWHEIDASWQVRTTDGDTTSSSPLHAIYYDPTRQWYRAESEDILVYWFGVSDELGHYVIDAMGRNREKYRNGFGELLPYRPVAIIYPPGGVWNEYKAGVAIDDTDFGSTGTIINAPGSTIQRVRTLEPAAIRKDCIWNPANPDQEFQFNQAASTTVHEVAHLYQRELGVGGPTWWVEGQATFFETFPEYPVHDRLRQLAQLRDGDFPTFQGEGPGGGPYTASEDGCTHLIYDIGSSFMLWLVDTHGGLDTYRAIVDEMARGITLEQALHTVTGLSLLELENEWRAFLGVAEVPAEILDPALMLGAPAEPYFEVGEQVILPATPFQQHVFATPEEKPISNLPCFANTPVTILRVGNDGVSNWYEVDCMGLVGWMSQSQLAGAQ